MTPEQFRSVARCINTPMLLVEGSGRILAANAAGGAEFRLSSKNLPGRSLAEFVAGPMEEVQNFLRTCSRSREQSLGHLLIKANHAAAIDYLFEGYLAEPRTAESPTLLILRFRPRSEARQSFVALNQKIDELTSEVSRRKRLEAERSELLASEKAARLLAERASRAKDEFLAIVSHELRAPLNVFKGWVDLLMAGEVEADEEAEVFSILQRNCDHQVRLIEDILDTSRVITGKLKLDREPLNIASIIENASEAIRATADAKDILLFVSANQSVGSVLGDADRLRQVVWNLLTNAVKFSPKGSKIFVSVRRADSKVEINVTDEGEGIDPDFLPFVFERFRQEDGSKTRSHGGLGLGLGIVRNIVELHGGSVAAASAGKSKGATFTVSLPLLATQTVTPISAAAEFKNDLAGASSKGAHGQRSGTLAGLRVLVVDDESDARNLISRILQRHGADVVTAASASDALKSFSSMGFGLVVSDIGMSGETGYDLVKKIRRLDAERGHITPVAAVTGFASDVDRKVALTAGFHEHLTKPVDAQRLIQMAEKLGRKTLE